MPMRGVFEYPSGLRYETDVLSGAEETALLEVLDGLRYDEVRLHDVVARRTVRSFGYDYDFDTWAVTPGDPVPSSLEVARHVAARLADVEPGLFDEVLVTRYPPGATIGWHRDATTFGPVVVGLSLRSDCVMRFQRRAAGGERRVYEQPLQRRSGYLLAGAARSAWQHSIPAVAALRYSITFRSVRRP